MGKPEPPTREHAEMLYTLDVRITEGPMTTAFVRQHPVVSRTIQIRSDQTLAQLHRAIFKAFEREDAHLYEFRRGDKFKAAPDRRYVAPEALEDASWTQPPTGVTSRTTIASLRLQQGDVVHYWFDFGDDWWHWIEVKAIERRMPDGRYPKVIGGMGASPPQYPPL